MSIPSLHDPHGRLHDGDADFDQPPGQQNRLAELVATVAVTSLLRFTTDLERLHDPAGSQQLIGDLPLVPERIGLTGQRTGGPVIEAIEQVASRSQPPRGHPFAHAQRLHTEIIRVGIALDLPRIVFGSQKAGVLAGPCQRAFDVIVRQRHARGDPVVARPHEIERGGKIGEVATGFDAVQIRTAARQWCRAAGQRHVGRQQVIVFAMGERPQDRPTIGLLRQAGQVFAESHTRDLRRDRRKLAADFRRRVRLGIDRIELAGTAAKHDQQDRLRFATSRQITCRRSGGRAGGGEETTGDSATTDRQKTTTIHQVQRFHGEAPNRRAVGGVWLAAGRVQMH